MYNEKGPVESFTSLGNHMPYTQSGSPREGMFKTCLESCRRKAYPEGLSKGSVQSALSGVEGKAAAVLTHGAYASYVSANAAKSGKSVSPKAARGQPCLAEARERRWRPFDQTQDRRVSTFPKGKIFLASKVFNGLMPTLSVHENIRYKFPSTFSKKMNCQGQIKYPLSQRKTDPNNDLNFYEHATR